MGLEDRQTNWVKNRAQAAEPNSEVRRDLRNVDDVETGFHILVRMIADYHLRRKDSYKQRSPDEEPDNTPR